LTHDKQILAAEDGFADERACDSVSNRVHKLSVPEAFESLILNEWKSVETASG
jgi:hypothetical protein